MLLEEVLTLWSWVDFKLKVIRHWNILQLKHCPGYIEKTAAPCIDNDLQTIFNEQTGYPIIFSDISFNLLAQQGLNHQTVKMMPEQQMLSRKTAASVSRLGVNYECWPWDNMPANHNKYFESIFSKYLIIILKVILWCNCCLRVLKILEH